MLRRRCSHFFCLMSLTVLLLTPSSFGYYLTSCSVYSTFGVSVTPPPPPPPQVEMSCCTYVLFFLFRFSPLPWAQGGRTPPPNQEGGPHPLPAARGTFSPMQRRRCMWPSGCSLHVSVLSVMQQSSRTSLTTRQPIWFYLLRFLF